MYAAILTSPEFSELCFLIAIILFVVALVSELLRPGISSICLYAGLALTATGLLAL